ncbi:hypothetical protein SCHPADRAFT_943670 [Schizopora paradoxa]|uniref:MARVEL domain-containing protein n=1 Tax=Schizopora paradoxa TaxID=27342 RepID=A0A0H2RBW9_9AGAM|nr:hypothetical protein SCHPADRAFT_943670 [Schizopora paradoxa]
MPPMGPSRLGPPRRMPMGMRSGPPMGMMGAPGGMMGPPGGMMGPPEGMMGPSGGGDGGLLQALFRPSTSVLMRRVFYLTAVVVFQLVIFGVLCTLRTKLNIFQGDSRTKIPNYLFDIFIINIGTFVAAFIQVWAYRRAFNPELIKASDEFISGAIAFAVFLVWIVFSSLLATQHPGVIAYYCGSGSFENQFCSTLFHTIEGLMWSGTGVYGVFTLDCYIVGMVSRRMQNGEY